MKFLQATLLSGLFLILSCGPQEKQPEMKQELTTTEIPPADYDPEARLSELGIELPTPSTPVANYVNAVRVGNLVFLAGKGPKKADGEYVTGKVGIDLTVEEGYKAARLAGISQLAVLKAELGNLNKVKRIVKVLGMVNATPDFTDQPEVVNGFSDLMVEVFGQRGKHARAAVGMGSLPRGIAVEVEAVVEVYE
jgi:enamine deaminase RidA (YjgF/YER057c/UK114 family)